MTNRTVRKAKAGDVLTFTSDAFIYAVVDHGRLTSRTSRRAESIQLTEGMLDEQTKDREGNHWADTLHDADEQTRRWGRVMFLPGPAPSSMRWYEPGSTEEGLAFAEARKLAFEQPEGPQRDAALAAVQEEFGTRITSTELWRSETGRRI
jgi:hypothetical protein